MNRFSRKVAVFALLGLIFLLSFNSSFIRDIFFSIGSSVQYLYIDLKKRANTFISSHFDQKEQILYLKDKVLGLEKELLEYKSKAYRYELLKDSLGFKGELNSTYILVESKGYSKIGNFQQLWLNSFEGYNPARNYGVIKDGYAIGIVVESNNRPLMILAGDPECSFAVYISKDRAPGIAMGVDERYMVVKYIPQWIKIDVGDEVYTSGLDTIFPPNVGVGKVVSIQKMQGFQNAYIELYGNTLHPEFVWVVSPK